MYELSKEQLKNDLVQQSPSTDKNTKSTKSPLLKEGKKSNLFNGEDTIKSADGFTTPKGSISGVSPVGKMTSELLTDSVIKSGVKLENDQRKLVADYQMHLSYLK